MSDSEELTVSQQLSLLSILMTLYPDNDLCATVARIYRSAMLSFLASVALTPVIFSRLAFHSTFHTRSKYYDALKISVFSKLVFYVLKLDIYA